MQKMVMFKKKRWATIATFLFIIFFIITFILWMDLFLATHKFTSSSHENPSNSSGFPINYYNGDLKLKCPKDFPVTVETGNLPATTCPEYFRWIHEDLKPWKTTGISRETLERAKELAAFRLVIVNGKTYVEKLNESYQTRDVFTVWGIMQLLRLYPGKVPDLELMFWCGDRPQIQISNYGGPNATSLPALFGYCREDGALDIVFPDWTFWGWPELNIKPWESLLKQIEEGNKRIQWDDRVPYAYWRGNPWVSYDRVDFMKCNVSDKHDWNARLYAQSWRSEAKQEYKNSKLEDQCTYRYKIYIEGWGWSVSEKYILACDSMVLFIEPHYYDFFTRSLVPMQHYWPIGTKNTCKDLKFAVEWGNHHIDKAKEIGKAGSEFIQKNLKMKHVYDYMLHVLISYSKLLQFQPIIPPGAVELCSERTADSMDGLFKEFMMESIVKSPSIDTVPCSIPPPYDPAAFHALIQAKEKATKQVETWESEYWDETV